MHFLISVGTNDIDLKDPEEILAEYVEIIELLRKKYPGIKITISELPPRKDNCDDKVRKLNGLLGDLCERSEYLFLAIQAKLRENIDRNMFDDKHIHRRAIHIFAGNIKRTLRKAYGLPEPVRSSVVTQR